MTILLGGLVRLSLLLALHQARAHPVSQAPAPLADRDLQVPGLHQGAELLSQERVRRLLGEPDSVVAVSDSEDTGESPESWWYYRDLVVSAITHSVEGVLLKTTRYATARALRVGDPAARLVTLYGKGKSAPLPGARADSADWASRFVFPYDSAWTYQLSVSREERGRMSPDALRVMELVSQQFGITVWVRNGKVACMYVGRIITDLSWWGC